jgi:dipeptidyl aminopeptidase/acylaminoacyl peptidase
MRFTLRALLASAFLSTPAIAQKIDYHRADVIRTAGMYVLGSSVYPRWLEDSTSFWYKSSGRADEGVYYLVDAKRVTKTPLFDNARLAAALSTAADTIIDPTRIPSFELTDTGRTLELLLHSKVLRCDRAKYTCQQIDSLEWVTQKALKSGPTWASRSPDKKWDVFKYRYNIYARPAELANAEAIAKRDSIRRAKADTSKKTAPAPKPKNDSVPLPSGSVQLTTDGVRFFAYGGAPRETAADTAKPKPEPVSVVWSPDRRKFTVSRDDQRNLRVYPMYSSTSDQPKDMSYYYATPGDSVVPTWDIHVIDVQEKTNVRAQNPPTPVATIEADVTWGKNSDRFFVVSANRGPNRVHLSAVDVRTGAATIVARDSTATWVELSPSWGYENKWGISNGGEDVIWWSQRDGWGHLYRFSATGELRNQIESGPYAVETLVRIDSAKKQLYFTAWGRDGTFPYYGRLFRINFDGTGLTLLTPEEGNHSVQFVPKADVFIDTKTHVDATPLMTLRSASDGKVIMELQRGDVEYLKSLGWRPPEIIQVKARDGVTDLWGLMYKPSNFDPNKKHPILDHIYPGPQVGSVSWGYGMRPSEEQALAELGFIVVEIDHMGTPRRSKAFHDFYFAKMGDNGIPDHIAGIRQLAARYPWMDVNKVGIYGHSGGGFASTDAIFRYPDFYKVAVSGAGNHDPRTYAWYWAGRYQGKFDAAGYKEAANRTHAPNFRGKLLIMHGDLDSNVHPANTFGVVDALIKANKNFDMLIFPDAGHGFPDYAVRRRWDFFVRHLLGVEPPEDYEMMKPPGGGYRF